MELDTLHILLLTIITLIILAWSYMAFENIKDFRDDR